MAPDPDTLAKVMKLKWKKGLTLKEAWAKLKKKSKAQATHGKLIDSII